MEEFEKWEEPRTQNGILVNHTSIEEEDHMKGRVKIVIEVQREPGKRGSVESKKEKKEQHY